MLFRTTNVSPKLLYLDAEYPVDIQVEIFTLYTKKKKKKKKRERKGKES